MRPRSKRARKLTPGELSRTGLLAFLCVAALVVTVQVSVAGVLRDQFPQLALQFEPADAEARGWLAGVIASTDPLPAARNAAQTLARQAIRRDPLSPVAVRALGTLRADQFQSAQPDDSAANLFTQAERLSRRDLVTQIWLAEYNLKRGNIPAVLRHFDVALRTSEGGEDSLFPLLVAASSRKSLADALILRMRGRPPWAQPFANYLLGGQVPPAISAYILQNALDAKKPDDLKVIETLMQRLADSGEMSLLRDVSHQFKLEPAKGSALVADGGFESNVGVRPFAWSLTGETDLWAAPEPGPRGGKVLALNASSGRSGELARQLVQLRPGRYRLTAEMGNVPDKAYLRPTLSVRCADGNRAELTTIKPSSAGPGAERIDAAFVVPPICDLQWLVVSMSGADSESSDLPWVDNVALTSAGG